MATTILFVQIPPHSPPSFPPSLSSILLSPSIYISPPTLTIHLYFPSLPLSLLCPTLSPPSPLSTLPFSVLSVHNYEIGNCDQMLPLTIVHVTWLDLLPSYYYHYPGVICDLVWPVSRYDQSDQWLHVTICNMWPDMTCDQLWPVTRLLMTICCLWIVVICDHVWPVTSCDLWPHVTCDQMWHVTSRDNI